MEYLSRAEVKPHRQEFQRIIEKVRKLVRKNKITFTYSLIGSAKRNMVLSHHNKGYDCDYNITIQKNENNLNEKEIKKVFLDVFDTIVVPLGYSFCEDSTQSITFRKVVVEESRVEKGFDVIITKKNDDGVHILRNDKKCKPDDYHFVLMRDTQDFQRNYIKINGNQMWQLLREIYKDKRERNEQVTENSQKKGFQLLSEAVNEVLSKNTRC